MLRSNYETDFERITAISNNKDIAYNSQNKFLDEVNFNNAHNKIEDELNTLYEKSRSLENMIRYGNILANTEVQYKLDELEETLKDIEKEKAEDYEKKYYERSFNIEYEVPLHGGHSDLVFDYDNRQTDKCLYEDEYLTSSYLLSEDLDIINTERKSSDVCYTNNIEDFTTTGQYVSYYLKQDVKTISEVITVFVEPTIANFFRIKPLNSVVNKVSLILNNDARVEIKKTDAYFFSENIKGIEFQLDCYRYKQEIYTVDTQRMKSNYWETMSNYYFSKYFDENVNTEEFDKATGLLQNKLDREKYLLELKNWKARVDEINKRNDKAMQQYFKDYQEYNEKFRLWNIQYISRPDYEKQLFGTIHERDEDVNYDYR